MKIRTSAGVVEILVQELLRRLLARKSLPEELSPAKVGQHASGNSEQHTSLAALAMSEKAAGADIVREGGTMRESRRTGNGSKRDG